MAILDYHGRYLLPSVWDQDDHVSRRFLAQLRTQMRRFPAATGVLLVGDVTGHYWQQDSDVDVVLTVPKQHQRRYADLANGASGYRMAGTDNAVRFWIMPAGTNPRVLQRHFGSVYDVLTGLWYGKPLYSTVEMLRPEAILQRANWQLYKAKQDYDPYPYEWRIVSTAFSEVDKQARASVLDALKARTAKLDANVTRLLTQQPRETWQAATAFEKALIETGDLPDRSELPDHVVKAILNLHRYADLQEILIDIDEEIWNREQRIKELDSFARNAAVDFAGLSDKILRHVDFLLQRSGGFKNAGDVMFDVILYLLENSRFFHTDIRRKQIARRLYDRFFRGG